MRISVITPTADQPRGIELLEGYMSRQTVQPDEWIVADDGNVPARLTMGQLHLVRPRMQEGGRSLASNMLAALDRVTGDVVVVFEHDDWYASDHIETSLLGLRQARATGSKWQRYYNVEHRCWIMMQNIGSALCNTAFRTDLAPAMRVAAERALEAGTYGLDRLFWDSLSGADKCITETETVVGIKGLPGRPGLGLGHRPNASRQWTFDPDAEKLREWVGNDASSYFPGVVAESAHD